MIGVFSRWLCGTALSWAMRGGVPWLWPACETIHFMGMTLLVGVVGVIDLRMIGVAKGMSLGPLQRLLPWGIAGFMINIVTGFMFFSGDPEQYTGNRAFGMKLFFLGLAGLNVIVFYMTGLYRKVDSVGPGQDVPFAAKLAGATSLFLWLGVMYWGRMLPFIGNSF